VAATLAALDATHCLPVDTTFEHRIDALRAAVELIKKQRKNGNDVPKPVASASAA
jgi:hypothetical protein